MVGMTGFEPATPSSQASFSSLHPILFNVFKRNYIHYFQGFNSFKFVYTFLDILKSITQ